MSPHNVQAQGAGVSDDFRVPTPSDFTTSCLVFVSRGREESGVQGRRGTTLPLLALLEDQPQRRHSSANNLPDELQRAEDAATKQIDEK